VVEGFQLTNYLIEDKTISEVIKELTASAKDAGWKSFPDEMYIEPVVGELHTKKAMNF